jgi:hypothetical protein
MKTVKDLIGTRKGEKALVICAGATTKEYQKEIVDFMCKEEVFTIGINNITHLFSPDYHLWVNTKRFRNFGRFSLKRSELLLGKGIHIKTIREVIGNIDYHLINFTDMKPGVPLGYRKGKILGFFRTGGNLAVMIAHLMGASEVNIVGMDGHTVYSYEEMKSGAKPHHCYDENYVPFDEELRIKKDKITTGVLRDLTNYGIKLRILTPTVYKEFYEGFK